MLALRFANLNECDALSALCLRSKAVWGYNESFIDDCRAELTVGADNIAFVQVAVLTDRIVGVVEVVMSGCLAQLDKLFVEPAAMGNGVGRKLFDWAKQTALSHGATSLTIESDPQAADFYRCMGAVDDGTVPSTIIPGRTIPRLRLQL